LLEQAEQILELMNEIYAIPNKLTLQDSNRKYNLLVEKGLMPILQNKLLTPSNGIPDRYHIFETKTAADTLAALTEDNIAVIILLGENYRTLQEDPQWIVKEISTSFNYPASSKRTKWIDHDKTHLTQEEFDALPKVILKSHDDAISIQNATNVVLQTESPTVAINAILNDLGIGIMADFYGELFLEKRKQLKTYAPLSDTVIHLLLVLKNIGDLSRGDFLEKVLKAT